MNHGLEARATRTLGVAVSDADSYLATGVIHNSGVWRMEERGLWMLIQPSRARLKMA